MTRKPERGEDGGEDTRDELERDLEHFGIDAEAAASDPDAEGAKRFEIWPENLEALELFASLLSQMRAVAGFGVLMYQGIEAVAVETALRVRRAPRAERARLFAEVLEMGHAAARALNVKRDV